jgi:hypothetical protein
LVGKGASFLRIKSPPTQSNRSRNKVAWRAFFQITKIDTSVSSIGDGNGIGIVNPVIGLVSIFIRFDIGSCRIAP